MFNLANEKFPSPYGVTVIKSKKSEPDILDKARFPSPYGVTVIKSRRNRID